MKDKRILITGACGFIGWHISKWLRKRFPSAEIVGLDNLSTGQRRDEEYLSHLMIADVVNPNCFQHGYFDEILHLASPASPIHYQADPHGTTKANVYGTFNCLEWLKGGGLFFLASTSEVYGDPIVHPQPETYHGQVSCTGVRACYDESKRLAETVALDADRRYGTRVKIARYFNVYGPGMRSDDGRAISNFIHRALRGEPLPIYGDGAATRSITYVDDAIGATLRLLYDTGLATGPVNIGSDQEIRIGDLAELIRDLCCTETTRASASCIRREAPAEDDPKQRKPDLTLARALLRWRASTHYREGLTITIREAMKEIARGEKAGE